METKQPPQEPQPQPKLPPKKDQILIALIEHGLRPAVYLVLGLLFIAWLFAVREPLLDVLMQAQSVKLGSFEVDLRTSVQSANLSRELQALASLDDSQLQLFLVLGRRRGYITYDGEELSEENLEKLRELGLLAEWHIRDDGGYWWRVSEEGHRLHDIVRNLIFSSIRRSAAS